MEKTAAYSLETTFVCKSYAFQELAMLYCPDCAPETASKTLSKWIRETRGLRAALEECGWKPRQKLLSPKMVGCMAHYLGEP